MKTRGFSIKSKVLVAPAMLLVLLLIECVFGWYALHIQRSSMLEIVEVRERAVLSAHKFIDDIDKLHLQTYRYFSWLGNADDNVIGRLSVDLKSEIKAVHSELTDSSKSESFDGQTKKTMGFLTANLNKYIKSVETSLDMSQVDAATGKQMLQASDDEFKKLRAEVTKWSEGEQERSRGAYGSALAVYDQTLTTGLVLALLSILIGVGVSLWSSNLISKPLVLAASVAREISDGRLQEIESPIVTDEASALLYSLSATSAKLRAVVARIHYTVDEVVKASGEISNSSLDLSARTERAAAALEQTSASMDQLANNISNTTSNAQKAASTANVANELAKQSGTDISVLVKKMNAITADAKRIADITSLIDGIAFQTNILALNAAVEAARAGEHGRGFAVVASEVRSLAQRCAAASKEISTLIKSSVTSVNDGARMVNEIGGRSSDLVYSIANLSKVLDSISDASVDQTMAVQEIKAAIFEIDRTTQQNASMVQDASQTAQALNMETTSLLQAVNAFEIVDAKLLIASG